MAAIKCTVAINGEFEEEEELTDWVREALEIHRDETDNNVTWSIEETYIEQE